ncbi:MAG: response regulator [Gammaproteobacteria bacterium]|jgi:CheY-like chemotaxis protein|nr:response regulator [Gammaproteobacteria bacterium]
MLQAIDQSTRQRRVLFVDDSKLMRLAGGKFLDGHCDLVLARDGREAWEMLERDDQIDLIFTDLMMPVMDGYELIRRVRRSPELRISKLPLLVVTGEDELNARELALSEGASDFIAKPFTPDDLRAALDAGKRRRPRSAPDRTAQVSELPAPHYEAGSAAAGAGQVEEPGAYCRRLQQMICFHQRQQLDLSLLHIQFQGYWRLKNRFGRHWAEAAMRNIDRVIHEELRDEDGVHRTADDINSVILMGTGRAGSHTLIRRLRSRLVGTHMSFASMQVPIDVRFAVQFPNLDGDDDPRNLLEEAFRLLHWRAAVSGPTHTPAG